MRYGLGLVSARLRTIGHLGSGLGSPRRSKASALARWARGAGCIFAVLLAGRTALPVTVSVDLGATDAASGLRNSQRCCDGDNDPLICGPQDDLRDARRNRGMDEDFDYYFYFLVTNPEAKVASDVDITATFYDDPSFAGFFNLLRLEYTNNRSTGPVDYPNTFALHEDVVQLTGTGRWVTHTWHIADAGFRTFMQGTSDFRFDLVVGLLRVCFDRVEVTTTVARETTNYALCGLAAQSSTAWGGDAFRAIDDNADGDYGQNSVTHTWEGDTAPWWEVDLLGEATIAEIVLWNRTDCCSDRLSNFRVSVFDASGGEVFGQDFFTDLTYPPGLFFGIDLPAGTRGSRVRISLLGPSASGVTLLSLAEVEVLGSDMVSDPPPLLDGINPRGWIMTGGWNLLLPLLNPLDCVGGGEEAMLENWVAPHVIGPEDPKAGDAWGDIDFNVTALSTGWGGAALFEHPTWVSNAYLETLGYSSPDGDLVDFEALARSTGPSEGFYRLSEIVPGTEHVTLVTNGDFEDRGPGCPDSGRNPPGWTRYNTMSVGPSLVPAPASTGLSVARGSADEAIGCSSFEQNITLEPNTEYILSVYMWNFGTEENPTVAVIDLWDAPGEAELGLWWWDADPAGGCFHFGSFNSGNTGTNVTLRIFGCVAGPMADPPATSLQWDNVAITPASEFVPPVLKPRPPEVAAEYVLGLATTYVENRTGAFLPVEICSSSDDSSQIWVNDQLITNASICRGTSPGCDETSPAILPPGISKIAVLVWQGSGGWSFRLGIIRPSDGHRYTDADSSELAFLGTGEGDPDIVGQAQYLLTRSFEPRCPEGGFNVLLTGSGPGSPGDPLTVTETVLAENALDLVIGDISNDGQIQDIPAPPAPELDPVGQFPSHGVVGDPQDCGLVNDTVFEGGSTYASMSATGGDIWADGDTFEFAYTRLEGDFDMAVRILSRDHSTYQGGWGQFGVMARKTLETDSKFSLIHDYFPLAESDDSGSYIRRVVHGSASSVEEPVLTEWFGDPNLGSGYINIGATPSLKVESAPFSLEAWVRLTGDDADQMVLCSSQDDYFGYFLTINRFGEHNIDLAKSGIIDQLVAYEFLPETWYHIAAVQHFQGSSPSYVEYFVNGASIGTFEESSGYIPSSGKEQRIAWAYGGMNRFGGTIDEVAVHGRALDPAEILQHYQGGLAGEGYCPGSACPSGLISYWKLDEGGGTTALDSVGGNHGSIIPAGTPPVWTAGQVNGALLFGNGGSGAGESSLKHPACMRLTRRGNVVEAWASNTAGSPGFDAADDANWALIFSDDWGPAAPKWLYVGFANCEHSSSGCAEQTIRFEVLRSAGTPAAVLYDSVLGKTITWNVSRGEADAGLGYSLRYPFLGEVTFHGDCGESITQGARELIVNPGDSDEYVPVDVHPRSCPNPVYVAAPGVLPVAILGTASFDVAEIDPDSVRLEGVASARWAIKDVAAPFLPLCAPKEDCAACSTAKPDRYLDMTFSFPIAAVAAALGEVSDGECRKVRILGQRKQEFGGAAFKGEDVIVILSKPRGQGGTISDAVFIRGDVNANGDVDLSDAIYTLGYLFQGTNGEPRCRRAADANDDGQIDLSDALYTLSSLFLGLVRIPQPYPGCGPDPTDDLLGCESYGSCSGD